MLKTLFAAALVAALTLGSAAFAADMKAAPVAAEQTTKTEVKETNKVRHGVHKHVKKVKKVTEEKKAQ